MLIKDGSGLSQRDVEYLQLTLKSGEVPQVHMTGESIDRIYKRGKLVDEIVGHNLVVNSFLNLVMCLLKKQSGYSGIQYWAVGSGQASWDSLTDLPSPALADKALVNEIGRVSIPTSGMTFLTAAGATTTTPTNILQISRTFAENECNGVWREFGLFGGNATATLRSGVMINKRYHKVITKTDEMVINRIMKFTLSLV